MSLDQLLRFQRANASGHLRFVSRHALSEFVQAWTAHIRNRQQYDPTSWSDFLFVEAWRLGLQSKVNSPHETVDKKREFNIRHRTLLLTMSTKSNSGHSQLNEAWASDQMTRYHPALVALHWLMAIMILKGLVFGKFALTTMDNADPEKAQGLAGHMTIGLAVGVLLVVRLIVRVASEKPPAAETGSALLDRVGGATHWILYLLIALMLLSGLGTAISAALFPIAFGGSGDPIPADLNDDLPRIAHGLVSNLLVLLLLLHVAAALYHQFLLRDGLFRRMWFGNRKPMEKNR